MSFFNDGFYTSNDVFWNKNEIREKKFLEHVDEKVTYYKIKDDEVINKHEIPYLGDGGLRSYSDKLDGWIFENPEHIVSYDQINTNGTEIFDIIDNQILYLNEETVIIAGHQNFGDYLGVFYIGKFNETKDKLNFGKANYFTSDRVTQGINYHIKLIRMNDNQFCIAWCRYPTGAWGPQYTGYVNVVTLDGINVTQGNALQWFPITAIYYDACRIDDNTLVLSGNQTTPVNPSTTLVVCKINGTDISVVNTQNTGILHNYVHIRNIGNYRFILSGHMNTPTRQIMRVLTFDITTNEFFIGEENNLSSLLPYSYYLDICRFDNNTRILVALTGVGVSRFYLAELIVNNYTITVKDNRVYSFYEGINNIIIREIENKKILVCNGDGILYRTIIMDYNQTSNQTFLPVMTAASLNNYVVSASTETATSGMAWLAFNQIFDPTILMNQDWGWRSKSDVDAKWLRIALPEGEYKKVNKYSMVMGRTVSILTADAPKNWTFQGSHDATNWVTLDTRTNINNWELNKEKEFTFNNETYYRYYQINITSNQTTDVGVAFQTSIGNIKLFSKDDILYYSNKTINMGGTTNYGYWMDSLGTGNFVSVHRFANNAYTNLPIHTGCYIGRFKNDTIEFGKIKKGNYMFDETVISDNSFFNTIKIDENRFLLSYWEVVDWAGTTVKKLLIRQVQVDNNKELIFGPKYYIDDVRTTTQENSIYMLDNDTFAIAWSAGTVKLLVGKVNQDLTFTFDINNVTSYLTSNQCAIIGKSVSKDFFVIYLYLYSSGVYAYLLKVRKDNLKVFTTLPVNTLLYQSAVVQKINPIICGGKNILPYVAVQPAITAAAGVLGMAAYTYLGFSIIDEHNEQPTYADCAKDYYRAPVRHNTTTQVLRPQVEKEYNLYSIRDVIPLDECRFAVFYAGHTQVRGCEVMAIFKINGYHVSLEDEVLYHNDTRDLKYDNKYFKAISISENTFVILFYHNVASFSIKTLSKNLNGKWEISEINNFTSMLTTIAHLYKHDSDNYYLFTKVTSKAPHINMVYKNNTIPFCYDRMVGISLKGSEEINSDELLPVKSKGFLEIEENNLKVGNVYYYDKLNKTITLNETEIKLGIAITTNKIYIS